MIEWVALVLAIEFVYIVIHDRVVAYQKKKSDRRQRGRELVSLWYRQIGGGDSIYWMLPFEERHSKTKSQNIKGIDLQLDRNLLLDMATSFEELRPEYVKYMDFKAARSIIKANWTYLTSGLELEKMHQWDAMIDVIEKRRKKDIIAVVTLFQHLAMELINAGQKETLKSDL